MLRQLSAELRKLLTRRIAIIIALLLVGNLVSLYFDTKTSEEKIERLAPYADAFSQLEEVCAEDPEHYVAYYEQMKADREKAYEEWEQSIPLLR